MTTFNERDEFDELYTLEAGAYERARGAHGTPSNGYVEAWDAANGRKEWQAQSGGGGTLAGDSDVAIASPADRNLLVFHSSDSKWHNDTLVAADIPALDASKITTGALALARGGTGVDLSAAGGTTKILAQDASHVISARDLVAGDIPALDASQIGSGTLAIARGGTNVGTYATGDILYGSAANVLSKLAIGGAGKVLTVSGGVPAWADISAAGNASLPYWVSNDERTKPASPNAASDYWDDSSGNSGPSNGLGGSWAWVNQSTSTVTFENGSAIIKTPTGAGDNKRMIVRNVPGATPYKFESMISCNLFANFQQCGIVVYDGTKLIIWGMSWNNNAQLSVVAYSTVTTGSATLKAIGGAQNVFSGNPWVRIRDDGTNLYFGYSMTGAPSSYYEIYSEARGTHLTTGPTKMGIVGDANNASTPTWASFGPFVVS